MSWLTLYKKEIRLTKTKFLLNIIFLLMVAVLFYVLIERYSPMFIMLTIPLIIVHLFYLFFAMIDSLRLEWKQKTSFFWLNIPRNGWELLSAKFLAATTQLFVSLLTTFMIIYFLLKQSSGKFSDPTIPQFLFEQYQSFWWILFFGIFVGSLQFGAVSTFIFMMSKSIRKWGWLIGVAITLGAGWLWSRFQETVIYKGITEWGVILNTDTIMNSFIIHIDEIGGDPTLDMEAATEAVLYIGTTVVDIVVVVAVLFISSWLLDNKVEA
ncbi:hypothetical protein BKP37_16060 [Anaerobacillus alkalilacustris]|uniref:Uncharacterized protein n=1 Tax=Anaerobacillus alkalilacustris TaxID=393763 RepID=A0A1S2LF70_9BACI|nr:hypothetical protein [Anaerobacillus alkalilacustris]OIJ11172.1 hypothetical protein BKP37_16060 [Anaerobacillus alkalilacustris]